MFKPRVALIVDQAQRDLAGLTLTAFELCQRGAICDLVPSVKRDSEIWAIAPDFVLLFSMRRGFDPLARKMAAAGIQFGVLDAEGGVWTDCESYAELLWNDLSLTKKLSFVCAWGPKLSDYLVDKGLLDRNQVTITGCPRFDFYHPTWRAVLYDDKTPEDAKRILLNANCTEANPRYATLEEISRYYARFGWSGAKVKCWVDIQRRQLDSVIDLARNLARDYSEEKIVVRPHPFESPDVYWERLSDLNNVEVNIDGPVQTQIFGAAAVIQRSCTTAIEAGLASVPTFSPQWVPTPAVVEIAESVSVPCQSYQELRNYLDSILKGKAQVFDKERSSINRVINDWFYRADGMAYKRVSNAIFASLRSERMVDDQRCRRYLYGLDCSPMFSLDHLSRRVRQHLSLSPDWSFLSMGRAGRTNGASSDQIYGDSDVRRLVDRIQENLKSNGSLFQPVAVSAANNVSEVDVHAVTLSSLL